jgi:hypothetical protein
MSPALANSDAKSPSRRTGVSTNDYYKAACDIRIEVSERMTGNLEIIFLVLVVGDRFCSRPFKRNCQFGWLRGSQKLLKGKNFLVAGVRFELTTFGL